MRSFWIVVMVFLYLAFIQFKVISSLPLGQRQGHAAVPAAERPLLTIQEGHSSYGGRPMAIAVSRDGKTLAIVMGNTLKLLDAQTGSLRRSLEHSGMLMRFAVFLPDGETVACCDGAIRLWHVPTGRLKQNLKTPAGDAYFALALSSDGRTLVVKERLVVRESRKPLLLWDMQAGKQRATLPGSEEVAYFALSPDGKMLASVTDDVLDPGKPFKYGPIGSKFRAAVTLWDAPDRQGRPSQAGGARVFA